MSDILKIGTREFSSRLLLGTGKFSNSETMLRSIRASGTQLVTVALRRFNPDVASDDLLTPLQEIEGITIMPNTSGARTAEEAVKTALIARELCGSSFVKVEIHPNPHHLLPDPVETYLAAKELCAKDFTVLPYMPADPVLAKRLEDVGCAAVMPLGSPIGSGQGLQSSEMIRIIIENSNVPVIVDAGLRSPGEAAIALELGCDAVLVNSAVAAAGDPEVMASAFAKAAEAGRSAYLAGLMTSSGSASATSPITSFLDN